MKPDFNALRAYIQDCSKGISDDQKPEMFISKSGEVFISDWDDLLCDYTLSSFGFVFDTSSGYYKYED